MTEKQKGRGGGNGGKVCSGKSGLGRGRYGVSSLRENELIGVETRLMYKSLQLLTLRLSYGGSHETKHTPGAAADRTWHIGGTTLIPSVTHAHTHTHTHREARVLFRHPIFSHTVESQSNLFKWESAQKKVSSNPPPYTQWVRLKKNPTSTRNW